MYTPKTGKTAGKINRKLIENYLETYPKATGVEISNDLGLSNPTVYKHLADIRKKYLTSQNIKK